MEEHDLYKLSFPRIIRYFLYRDVGSDEAEDLAQETYVRFFAKYRCNDMDETVCIKILYTIARNIYREWVRERVNRPVYELQQDFPITEPVGGEDDVEGYDDTEALRPLLMDALAGLNPTLRQVVTLRLIEGLTRRETAERLSIKEKDVHTYQKRAVRQLRDRLSDVPRSAYTF
ncbi:MAG: RNA polymerase sigma factor [bacterium]